MVLDRRSRVGAVVIVLPGTSHLRRFHLSPLGTGRRCLYGRLLMRLVDHGVTRLVAVVCVPKHLLLLRLGIPTTRILPLIDRQRCACGRGATVPPIPSASTLFPCIAPVLAPPWRRIRLPALEVCRRLPVVGDGDSQDVHGHDFGSHQPPRPVVPGARIPGVPLVGPVHAIIEKVVRRRHLWSVVDRRLRHRLELWIDRQVDPDAHAGKPDADAHLSNGRRHPPRQHPQHHE